MPFDPVKVARMTQELPLGILRCSSTLDAESYRPVAAVDSRSIADQGLLEFRVRIMGNSGREISASLSARPDSHP